MNSGIVRIYATSCEKDGKNFYSVPARLQEQVRALIEADGYIIQDDGTVIKPVPNVEEAPAEEETPEAAGEEVAE